MSETVSQGREAGRQVEAPTGAAAGVALRRRRVRRGAAALVIVVAAAGVVWAWRAGAFKSTASSGGVQGASAPSTQLVVREDLIAQTQESATLGYAASYTVTGKGSGTLTSLPSVGQVIHEGQVLYQTDNGSPVVLMYGNVPAWRSMSEGTTGSDVTQLNHDLVDLGYANISDVSALGWDYYSWATNGAVQQLEEHLGVSSPSGSLSLGQVVFQPEALRVSTVTGSLGGSASGPILRATSDRHVVTIALSTANESQVKAGDAVTVTLPDGNTTPGVITSVGTVASGSGSNATIPVYVKLTKPSVAGSLDQAPVTVNITTATAPGALAVPVAALLAQSSGGYVVEVAGAGGTRHLVPVQVGLYDQAAGMVQVTGALTPGEQVVVPSS
jgi:hypothetical protein